MPTIKQQFDELERQRVRLQKKLYRKGILMDEDAKFDELVQHMYDAPVDLRTTNS